MTTLTADVGLDLIDVDSGCCSCARRGVRFAAGKLAKATRALMLPWGLSAAIAFVIAVAAVETDPSARFNFHGVGTSGDGLVVQVQQNGTAVPLDVAFQLADAHLGGWAVLLGVCLVIVPPLQLLSSMVARLLIACAPGSLPAFRLYVATVQGPAWRVGWTGVFPVLWSWVLGDTAAGSIRLRLALVLGVAAVFEGVISLSLRIFRQTSHLAAFQVKVDNLQSRMQALQAFTLLAASVEASRRRFRRLFQSSAVALAAQRALGPGSSEAPKAPEPDSRGQGGSGPPHVLAIPESSEAASQLPQGRERATTSASEPDTRREAVATVPPATSEHVGVTVTSPASLDALGGGQGVTAAQHGARESQDAAFQQPRRVALTPELLSMVKVSPPAAGLGLTGITGIAGIAGAGRERDFAVDAARRAARAAGKAGRRATRNDDSIAAPAHGRGTSKGAGRESAASEGTGSREDRVSGVTGTDSPLDDGASPEGDGVHSQGQLSSGTSGKETPVGAPIRGAGSEESGMRSAREPRPGSLADARAGRGEAEAEISGEARAVDGRQARTEARVSLKPRPRLPWGVGPLDGSNGEPGTGALGRRNTAQTRREQGGRNGAIVSSQAEPTSEAAGRWLGGDGTEGLGDNVRLQSSSSSVSGGTRRTAEFQFVPRATAMQWGDSSIAEIVEAILRAASVLDDEPHDSSTDVVGDPRAQGDDWTAVPGTEGADPAGVLRGVEDEQLVAQPDAASAGATATRAVLAAAALGVRLQSQVDAAARAAVATAAGDKMSQVAAVAAATAAAAAAAAAAAPKRATRKSAPFDRDLHNRGTPGAAALSVWGALTGTASSALPLFAALPPASTGHGRHRSSKAGPEADRATIASGKPLPAPGLLDVQSPSEARLIAAEAFDQLDYRRSRRLTVESLSSRLGLTSKVARALLTALAGVPTDVVSRRDVSATAAAVIRDVQALGHTVDDFGALTTALRLAAMAVWGVVVLFVGLWAFEVSLLDVIVPLGLLFTSLSFAAGEPARIFFMGLFVLTVYAPFEVGDRVSINGSRVATVTRIEVCATWLRNVHGKSFMVSNHTLLTSVVENFRRCKEASVENIFTVGYRTTPRQLDALLDAALAHVRALPNRWEGSVSCYIKDGSGVDGVINFVVWLDHRHSWMESSEVLTDASRFTIFMIQTMRRLGIEHIKSPQPIIHVDPLPTSRDTTTTTAGQAAAEGGRAHSASRTRTGEPAPARADGWRVEAGRSLVEREMQPVTRGAGRSPFAGVPRALLPSEFMSDLLSRGYDGTQWASLYEPPRLGAISKVAGNASYEERQAATVRRRQMPPKLKQVPRRQQKQ